MNTDKQNNEEMQRTKRLEALVDNMKNAGPQEASAAMVLYSDTGWEAAQAVIAAAAKILSESSEPDRDVESFKKLVGIFKNA